MDTVDRPTIPAGLLILRDTNQTAQTELDTLKAEFPTTKACGKLRGRSIRAPPTNTKHWDSAKPIAVNTSDDRDTLCNKLQHVQHWFYFNKPSHDIDVRFPIHAQDVLRLVADLTDKKMTLGQSLFGLLRMLTYGLENVIAIPVREFQILSQHPKPNQRLVTLYVELVFRGNDDDARVIQSAVDMCRSLGSSDGTLNNMIKAVGKQKTLNQVYIPADFSHPYGIFFQYLAYTSHINRLKGLIINMIGGQNAIRQIHHHPWRAPTD
ncbi:hypothetical protein NW768_002183 [Fusarium equiseti]|uniref:Uncharacterized protein n=1 Tax=Fusarium equiseti TaxID=61235 RepID=A0ABQ8RMV6_FUSEQ|nr:hypothetical protein NW768_002183 [Fusarium equiseti]